MVGRGLTLVALTGTWIVGWIFARFLIGERGLAYPQGCEPDWFWWLVGATDAVFLISYFLMLVLIVRARGRR